MTMDIFLIGGQPSAGSPVWQIHLSSSRSFGAGKTRSLTFLLWLALTTHLKIAVVHKENLAGGAITKLLTAFELKPDQ